MEYYSALYKEENSDSATTWRTLENIIPREMSQEQNTQTPLVRGAWGGQIRATERKTVAAGGWGKGRMGSYCLVGIEF